MPNPTEHPGFAGLALGNIEPIALQSVAHAS
jgi:hypothetical protein